MNKNMSGSGIPNTWWDALIKYGAANMPLSNAATQMQPPAELSPAEVTKHKFEMEKMKMQKDLINTKATSALLVQQSKAQAQPAQQAQKIPGTTSMAPDRASQATGMPTPPTSNPAPTQAMGTPQTQPTAGMGLTNQAAPANP